MVWQVVEGANALTGTENNLESSQGTAAKAEAKDMFAKTGSGQARTPAGGCRG